MGDPFMEMMTAGNRPSGKTYGRAQRLSAQAPAATKKAPAAPKDQADGRDDLACLARQAGPGPRM
jgi:hypothetical protein